MLKITKKKLGIFLGRLQPQHKGHEHLIEKIFEENDEVILCVGSAQKIAETDPLFSANPLSTYIRVKRLKKFLQKKDFDKPYMIIAVEDIEPDEAWPAYLKKRCRISDDTINTIYFGDAIPQSYKNGLEKVGFKVKIIKRKKFAYQPDKDDKIYKISSATEIRKLEKSIKNL